MFTKPMIDISHENPMYCETSPPNNGPKKYARLTLFEFFFGKLITTLTTNIVVKMKINGEI